MTLEPLTDYSRFKADCEKILAEYQADDFTTVTIRPATVCGYSRRQRLDVVVNILTNLAYHKREITVFGGSQLRPNIHIADMVQAYVTLLKAPTEKIAGQIFNAGYENQSVTELAETVKDVIGDDVKMTVTPTDDNRSYHISSERSDTSWALSHNIPSEKQLWIWSRLLSKKSYLTRSVMSDTSTSSACKTSVLNNHESTLFLLGPTIWQL